MTLGSESTLTPNAFGSTFHVKTTKGQDQRPSRATSHQRECRPALLLDLRDPALLRRLVRTPAEEARPVAEAAAIEVIVAHLDDQLRRQRLPLGRPRRAPATRTARRLTGEARRLHEFLEALRDRLLLGVRDVRREADVVQQPRAVVQPEQQRAHVRSLRRVAE